MHETRHKNILKLEHYLCVESIREFKHDLLYERMVKLLKNFNFNLFFNIFFLL